MAQNGKQVIVDILGTEAGLDSLTGHIIHRWIFVNLP